MKNKLLFGNIIGALAYLVWGALPLFWALLSRVSSFEIIAHRIILSFLLLGLIFIITKKKNLFEPMRDKRTRIHLILAGLVLFINWSTFIIAVLANHVMECSLAYYINPLIVIAIGMIFFKESTAWLKLVAVSLAVVGVLILSIGYGRVPYFALVMAVSFGTYGVLKKQVSLDAYTGLFFEMMTMLPIAIGIETYVLLTGGSIYFGGIDSIWFLLILMMSGVLTMLPLVLYNTGLNMIAFGNMGFLLFITPTMMFFISVFVNKEPFTTMHLISFIFIWTAVILYCINLAIQSKKKKMLTQ